MFDGLNRQIDVEVGTAEVVRAWPFHQHDFANPCVLEPGELLEGHEKLALIHEQPESFRA
jgi:hypothetical protein